MQTNRAHRTPDVQPNRPTSQPPNNGPIIIGRRRTMDCTPMPIVCWRASSEVATTVKVVGSDKALQARNKNAPSTNASQCCQNNTRQYPPHESALNNSSERRWPQRSVSQPPG